jgi:lipid A 3-O-deacylase
VRRALIAVLAAFAPIAMAIAQTTPRTLTLRVDNDAFNFWTMPWKRPDGEYTSGVRITYDGGAAPAWARSFWSRAPSCVKDARQCRTSRAELGQDIYTPLLADGATEASPGTRPSAGWLYVSQTARALSEDRSDEITVTLGVTGPPSLAELSQRLAHAAAPELNRPTDWSREIGFEPGAMLRYEQERRLSVASRAFDIIPRFAATVGNVEVSAETGVRARLGWSLRHPWLPESGETEIAIVSGASVRAVARDLFLDGNTFHGGARVGHRPFVGVGELGLQIRHNEFPLAYRTVTTSRAYDGGPRWHPWSSMVAGVTFDR